MTSNAGFSILYSRARITPTDQGPYIVVTGYILMSVMILCTALRFARTGRKAPIQAPRLDEVSLLIATILAVAEDIVIQKAVQFGFGSDFAGTSSAIQTEAFKMIYVARLLSTASVTFAKISILYFIGLLAVTSWTEKLNRAIMFLAAAWGIAAILAFAFQCQLPSPWTSRRCINQRALNYFDIIVSMDVDILTFVLPVAIIWNVRMDIKRKFVIAAAFATRLILCICEIFQILSLHPDENHQYSGNEYSAVLWMQIVVNLSAISAAVPSLQSLFRNLHSGLMDTTLLPSSVTSTVNTWEKRMQSGGKWSLTSSKQPKTTTRPEYWELEDANFASRNVESLHHVNSVDPSS